MKSESGFSLAIASQPLSDMQNKIPFMWRWKGRLVRKGKNFRYLALLNKKLTQQGVAAWKTR